MTLQARISPVSFVVREAGLRATSLGGLRSIRTSAHVTGLVQAKEWLDGEGASLAAALHDVIGDAPAGPVKPGLVGLRRALHQGRAPGGRAWNEGIAQALATPLRERVSTWIARRRVHTQDLLVLPGIIAAEDRAAVAALREAAADPRFRRALHQATPPLSAELEKWLADERRIPQRQSLVRLAKYVARAATKTSPYSTFTISGLGAWIDSGPAIRMIPGTPVGCVSELYGSLLHNLSRMLCKEMKLEDAFLLGLNPSVSRRGETITFVRPQPRESIVSVPATPALNECLRAFGDDASHTLAELSARLSPGNPESAERFVARLLEAGLVERRFPVADQSGDPLGDLSAWLAEHAPDHHADSVAAVDRLRDQLRRSVPVDEIGAHMAHQRALGAAVQDLAQRAGTSVEQVTGRSSRVVHENAVFLQTAVACDSRRWDPALRDLGVVCDWLATLDPGLPRRIVLGAYCRERFGSGSRVSLLELQRAVQEEISLPDAPDRSDAAREIAVAFQPAAPPTATWLAGSRLPRLRTLEQVQRAAREAVLGPSGDGGVIRVDPAVLERLTATRPAWIAPADSYGCHVQPVDAGGAMHLVVNSVGLGYGRGLSRVRFLIEQAGGAQPPAEPLRSSRAEPVLCELGAVFGLPLNQRTPELPYEIGYPLAVSDRPQEERLPLGDLDVVHDPRTDLAGVFSRSLGREVLVTHLGMMSELNLPPVAALLVQAFSPSSFLMAGGMTVSSPQEAVPASAGVVASPRVEVGRVVVRRARWTMAVEHVPQRGKGDSDAVHLLRLATWRRARGIPDTCFVRMPVLGFPAGDDASVMAARKSRKPVFVDFASLHLISAFERMLRSCPGPMVIFEEALPSPDDSSNHPHITEFLLEIRPSGSE